MTMLEDFHQVLDAEFLLLFQRFAQDVKQKAVKILMTGKIKTLTKRRDTVNIGIFDALRIYRNPLTFFVRVEKDSETKKYGVSFCLKKDDGSVHTIRRWSLISEDLNVVINKTETFLKLILVHGSKAYLEKGTYLFNHYNSKSYDSNEDGMSTDDEKYVLSEMMS